MTQKFGFVAIVGRPNVGKSTLLNHILGFKLSITSRKPQTTRHRVLGIWTEEQVQIAFVDTPGMHTDQPKAMNRMMNQTAEQALSYACRRSARRLVCLRACLCLHRGLFSATLAGGKFRNRAVGCTFCPISPSAWTGFTFYRTCFTGSTGTMV